MSYLKLLNARSKSGRQPTMEPHRLSRRQKAWAREGTCIECGKARAGKHSYICAECEAKDTIEDIRSDLEALRRKILNKPGG